MPPDNGRIVIEVFGNRSFDMFCKIEFHNNFLFVIIIAILPRRIREDEESHGEIETWLPVRTRYCI